ncbi:hypothetical protein Bca4012_079511 [Brassica carinata]|uniref:Uncharacterized protein n=1 Tax=Brassica carinata TaxID=52824 RepID=A0A8X7Q6G5_BRACI|nr:uncharacterized protein LOC106401796 [Brassica napus]KAG2263547.1 hypothetical protein Bca52824_070626 [Brassica carinata]
MDIRILNGEEADAATVTNLGNKKQPSMSPSVSSSSVSSTSVVIDSFEEEDEFEWVAVEREDKAYLEIEEVEDAFSALQLMFNEDDDDKSEDQVSDQSEFVDWIEPPLQLCNTSLLQPYMLDRFYDAFHMFQTDPSVQRMVMSLASDRAVWDAVMNNEVVRELITNAERSEEDSGITMNFIRRLLQRSAIKIMDAMEGVTKYVTDLFIGDDTVVLATGAAPVMEKLQMTVLLTIVVLLIVFVTRATRAR